MLHAPLNLADLVFRGAGLRPNAEVITRREDRIHRQTLAQTAGRAAGLARGLAEVGVERGDRVATLMWNDHHHLEAYLAVPCMGAVLHALNLRLSLDDLVFVIEDAGDSVILSDAVNADMARALAEKCDCVREVVTVGGGDQVRDWESLADTPGGDPWVVLDEDAPMGICHTSGTTGAPKGVVYTHRSTCVHTLLVSMTDFLGLSYQDRLLNIVPMFHALAWGLPYAACMIGADIVLPGERPNAENLLDLVDSERITCSAAVATVWSIVMQTIESEPERWHCRSLQRIMCGGSSASRELRDWYRETLGLQMGRSWGMTELNPVGTAPYFQDGNDSGIALPLVQLKLEDDDGKTVPHDGSSTGHLLAKGPTVIDRYLHDRGTESFRDGWLITGDIASIGVHGEVTIRDREKDVIKSGGEWISSLELELRINDIPGVAASAVVARVHPTWGERPVALVVLEEGVEVSVDRLRSAFKELEKWQRPDDFLFVEALPLTGTGKIDKNAIRFMLDEQQYVLPALRDRS